MLLHKIGIDVAVEALADFTRKYRGKADELACFARFCRVGRVMQPYLDAIGPPGGPWQRGPGG